MRATSATRRFGILGGGRSPFAVPDAGSAGPRSGLPPESRVRSIVVHGLGSLDRNGDMRRDDIDGYCRRRLHDTAPPSGDKWLARRQAVLYAA